MERSSRVLVGLTRRSVSVASATLLVAVCGLAIASANPAQGYAESGTAAPWAVCSAASQTNLRVFEASLGPTDGATVTAGMPVTFTGHSESQPTFAIASSPALLPGPDIDSGLGSALPEPSSAGPPVVYAYAFTSAKASAAPGTVYWDASISDATIPACAGQTPGASTTKVRTLTVQPAPVSAPAPAVARPPVQESLFGVDVNVLGGFRLAHPVVSYNVHCTASCSGETSYKAFVMRRHAKPAHVSELDLTPRPVSITGGLGGDQRFTHRYSGHALHLLKRLLAKGGVVELRLAVHVEDASGEVVGGQSTVRLRM